MRNWLDEVETAGVESLPRNHGGWLTVEIVAENRASDGGEVDTELVRSSRYGMKLDEG